MNDTTWIIVKIEDNVRKVLAVDFSGIKTYSLIKKLGLKHKFYPLYIGSGHTLKDINESEEVLKLDFYERFNVLDDVTDVFNECAFLFFYGDNKKVIINNDFYFFHCLYGDINDVGPISVLSQNCYVRKDFSGDFHFEYRGKQFIGFEIVLFKYITNIMTYLDYVFINHASGNTGFLLKIELSEKTLKTLKTFNDDSDGHTDSDTNKRGNLH